MLGKRARASSAMTLISPFSMGRLKSRSRTFKLRRWALSVWNSSVKHNTHFLSHYRRQGTNASNTTHTSCHITGDREPLCQTQHTPIVRLPDTGKNSVKHNTHFLSRLQDTGNNSVKHNTLLDRLQDTENREQLCQTQHTLLVRLHDTQNREQLCQTQHALLVRLQDTEKCSVKHNGQS